MIKIIEEIDKFTDDQWANLIGPVDKAIPTAKEASATATVLSWACESVGAPILIIGGNVHLWNGKNYEFSETTFDDLLRPALRRLKLYVSQAANVDFLRSVEKSISHLSKLTLTDLEMNPRGLNFQDGVLMITRNSMEWQDGHNPSNVFTYCLPFNYKGKRVKSKVWAPFIEQIMPDKEIRDYTLASFANAIGGDPMQAQRMLMLMGVGASGKSTLIDAVVNTVGQKNAIRIDDLKNLTKDDSRYRIDLANNILCICGDASGNIGNKDVLKQIISKEELSGRRLFKEVEYFTPRASLLVASNEIGFTHALGDSGIARRIDIVQFQNPVAEKDRDPHIGLKLAEDNEQREMVLDMLACMIDMQQEHGKMVRPDSLSAALNDLMYDGDSFLSFMGWSGLEVAKKEDKENAIDVRFVHQSELKSAFGRFSIEYGNAITSMKNIKSKCRFHGAVERPASGRSHNFKFKIVDEDLFTKNFCLSCIFAP